MGKVDYDKRLHGVYAAGRQMSPDALHTWMEAFARHLPPIPALAWLRSGREREPRSGPLWCD